METVSILVNIHIFQISKSTSHRLTMLSGASLDCQYDYDDEHQHAFDDDEGDLTVEGPTLEHSSTAGFLHTNKYWSS